MRLKVFRSLWGCKEGLPPPHSNASIAAAIRRTNLYSGIEASLYDLGGPSAEQRNEWKAIVADNQFELITGLYTSWQDYEPARGHFDLYKPVHMQVDQFNKQLQVAVDEFKPSLINVHAGNDLWTDQEASEFFKSIEKQVSECPIPVCFETHRSRVFGSPCRTYHLLKQFPWIRLTLDFSHWIVNAERNLGSSIPANVLQTQDSALQSSSLDEQERQSWNDVELKILKKVAEHTYHIHARLSSSQRPQLGKLDCKQHTVEIEGHWNMWRQVWSTRAAENKSWLSMTPEYGPMPYCSAKDEPNIWNFTNDAAISLKNAFPE
jgi:hypothetical protein